MSRYLTGTAAMTSTNVIAESFDGRRSMILPEAFEGYDFEQPIAILLNHNWNERLGSTDDNAKVWMDGSKLRFTVLLKDTCTSDVFKNPHWHSEIRGASINCTGFSETRYDRNGRPYTAMMKVIRITDVGPVASPADPFCAGITLTDYSPAPRRAVVSVAKPVARTTATSVANHSGGKRARKLMSVGPMPAGMIHGMQIASAAEAGQGVKIGAITLSAGSVQNLIRNRLTAIL